MKRVDSMAAALLAFCSVAHAGPRLLVPNYGQGTVAVFDQASLSASGAGIEVDTIRPIQLSSAISP
jgi:hypothetical protein